MLKTLSNPLSLKRIALTISCAAFLAGQSAADSASPAKIPALNRGQLDALHQELENVFKDQNLVGFQAAIFDRDRVVSKLNLGYADLEHQVPVITGTRFEIASITKVFTGLALLKLDAAGGIDLDAPIQKTVPGFPVKEKGTVTPRLLAGALGGIRHYNREERTPAFYATHYDDVLDALALFKDDPLVLKPGERTAYTSYGYNLLAASIQGASGEKFERYVQRMIVEPLRLTDTGFIDVRVPLDNRSRNYSYIEPLTREVLDHLRTIPRLEHSYNMGGGNMYSSAKDLATLGGQFLKPGFISKDILDQVYAPHTTLQGDPTYFSDGWLMNGINATPRYLFMGGSYPGTLAALVVYPDHGVAISYTANTWGQGGGQTFGPNGSLKRFAEKMGALIEADKTTN